MSSNAGPVAALSKRDGAGAAPIHAAFLYGKADLGKVLLQKYPECALHAPGCVCSGPQAACRHLLVWSLTL